MSDIELKICTKCGKNKPATREYFFYSNRGTLRAWCIKCCGEDNKRRSHKNAEQYRERAAKYAKSWRKNNPLLQKKNRDKYKITRRLKKYGITHDEFLRLKQVQNNSCKICGLTNTKYELVVDHDHETGEIRGLLCLNCNAALGLLKDSPRLCALAGKYLSQRSLALRLVK